MEWTRDGVCRYPKVVTRIGVPPGQNAPHFSTVGNVMETPAPAQTFAAVDLGSNSFHMIVARAAPGGFQVLDRLREMVQLGAGLDVHGNLIGEARERALACLQRFGQRLQALPKVRVRVVGTNTLRKARNAGAFIREAQQALGHPIEVISGIEEARLIYLGVSHSLPDAGGRRLVVDIGGGSTELIVGERFEPIELTSLYMGCVSMSRDYFGDGDIDKPAMRRAEIAALQELETITERFGEQDWQQAVGASGTVRAIAKVAEANGWCEDGISRDALKKLRKALLSAGKVDKLKSIKGLSDERAPIFAGGFMVLSSVFEALDIEHMQVADGALREGLIWDMLGRVSQEDVRERTVNALCQSYFVDRNHGARVEATALTCLEQVAKAWDLEGEEYAHMLGWAARLHEVGLGIAHSQFHKHGAYLAQHSDMPGFSQWEQTLLAALIRGHRRKFPVDVFAALPPDQQRPATRLCALLRLAVTLHRSRSRKALPRLALRAGDDTLALEFPDGWLDDHALTAADLARERDYLAVAGIELSFS